MNELAELEARSDADLVERCARGDETAFLVLYRRHKATVFRFALHMSSRREIAEEVTQEVFLFFIGEPRRFAPGRGTLEGYLLGVARNKVRACLRLEGKSMQPLNGDSAVPLEPQAGEAGERDERSEMDLLRSAIVRLPLRYREVVVLCELEEKSYSEASELLGCAIGTVRSRLHRARQLLSAKLKALEGCAL